MSSVEMTLSFLVKDALFGESGALAAHFSDTNTPSLRQLILPAESRLVLFLSRTYHRSSQWLFLHSPVPFVPPLSQLSWCPLFSHFLTLLLHKLPRSVMSNATYFGEICELTSRAFFDDSDEEAEKKECESLEESASKLEPRICLDPPNANFTLPQTVTKVVLSMTDFNHSLLVPSLSETVINLTTFTANTSFYAKKEADLNAVKGIKVALVQSKLDPTTVWLAFNKMPHITGKSGRLVEVTHEILSLLLHSNTPSGAKARQVVIISHEKIQGEQSEHPIVYLTNQFFNFAGELGEKQQLLQRYKLLPPAVISSPVQAYAFQLATLASGPAIALVMTDADQVPLDGLPLFRSLIPGDIATLIEKGSVFLSSHRNNNMFT